MSAVILRSELPKEIGIIAMSHIIIPKAWKIPEKEVTDESVYRNRRHFLKLMGFTALGIAGALSPTPALAEKIIAPLAEALDPPIKLLQNKYRPIPDLKRNDDYPYMRQLTDENVAGKFNNFYEFSAEKETVWKMINGFKDRPWSVEVGGLVDKPGTFAIDELLSTMSLEERVTRLRCVEAWAMIVPWSGFPLSDLIDKVQPKSSARYVKFTTFEDAEIAPGQKRYPKNPWPYTEAITMQEALNELSFMATGIYGHSLPAQHGGPIRLVFPWKYGFKSIKSIVRIDFIEQKPATFWNTLLPNEYEYEANVNPDIPHPRWSQRREKMIGTGEIYATVKYNGYGDFVASLYS